MAEPIVSREEIEAQRLEYQARLARLQEEYDRLLLELDKAERGIERVKGGIAALNALLLPVEKVPNEETGESAEPASLMAGSSCTAWVDSRWPSTPTVNITATLRLSEAQKEGLFSTFERFSRQMMFAEFEQGIVHSLRQAGLRF
jgi:hypothetical protein